MKRRLVWLLVLVGFLALALVFVLLFRQQVRQWVVQPLVYLFWQASRAWRSTDPDIIWSGFILLALALCLMTFPAFQRAVDKSFFSRLANSQSRETYAIPERRANPPGRLLHWYWEIEQIPPQRFVPRFAVLEVKKLVLSQLAFLQGLGSRAEAEEWVEQHEDELPPAVRQLFHPQAPQLPNQVAGFFRRLWRWYWSKEEEPSPLASARDGAAPGVRAMGGFNAIDLDAILDYLEQQIKARGDPEV